MVTIIGAGLSGLAIAYRLNTAGIAVSVLEANSVAGGRIQSAPDNSTHQDLGPSWVWPYAQPVLSDWLHELKLSTFPQYDSGDGLVDSQPDAPATRHSIPGQHGMVRINGGTHAIIRTLLKHLPDPVQCNAAVTSCAFKDQQFELNVSNTDSHKQTTLTTDNLVVATAPRQAAALFNNQPPLTDVLEILQQTPTWMAPQAKVVILYKKAFWRESGLSGRVASHVGPLVEIHDHCGPDGTPAALFGFVGIPAAHRTDVNALTASVKQQLIRCFGNDAPAPEQIIIKDWAREQYISTSADLTGAIAHPSVTHEVIRQPFYDGSLWFAASETSTTSPGLIEGALARADEVANHITAKSR